MEQTIPLTPITSSAGNDITLTRLLERLYEPGFYQVALWVSRQGGSREAARDIFHDALLVLHQRHARNSSVDDDMAYLIGVAKNLWYQKLRAETGRSGLDDNVDRSDEEQVRPNEAKLITLLEQTGKRCLELLTSFYVLKESAKKLKDKFGFTSEHSASVQKYKCIEKVRETIKQKQLRYENFFE